MTATNTRKSSARRSHTHLQRLGHTPTDAESGASSAAYGRDRCAWRGARHLHTTPDFVGARSVATYTLPASHRMFVESIRVSHILS